jgi:two-component system sensor histidine kinase VicK
MTYYVNPSEDELYELQTAAKGSKEQQRQDFVIQKLRLANEKLKVQNKVQEQFIYIAALELRTPIQPIIGSTESLRSKIKDAEQIQFLDAIIRNAKRLQRLTEDLLDVTKIESHLISLKKEKLNLIDLVSGCMQDYINQFGSNKITFNLLYGNGDFFLEADISKLTQVISNLLSNAIKFIKESGVRGGIISVIIERKDVSHIAVRIKDNGIGINPVILPTLFTKFATKSERGGTGLGLFISKSIIEAHGGKICAENNADGKGATVTFILPAMEITHNKR